MVLSTHALALGNELQVLTLCVGAVSAISLGTELERGGMMTKASGASGWPSVTVP